MAIEKDVKTTSNENNNVASQPQQSYQNADDLFAGLGIETQSGGVDTEGFNIFAEEMMRRAKSPEIASVIKITVVPVTSQTLFLPVLAMAVPAKEGVIVYSLLIEGMMSAPLDPIIEVRRDIGMGQQGGEIVIDRPTSRCYDTELRNVVANAVASAMGVNVAKVIHQSHCVVPKSAKLSSPEVCRLFFDTANLALTSAVARDKIRGVTAAHLTSNAVMINQKTTITPGQNKLSKIGTPIAADFTTRLELVKRNNENKGLDARMYEVHQQQTKYNLAEVSGYIDFAVVDAQPTPAINQMTAPTKPGFMPILVITEIAGLANNGRSIENLGTQILGIASTVALTMDHGWVRILESSAGSKSEKASIGLLGLEHDPFMGRQPEYGVVPVESVSFGKQPKEGSMTPKQVADLWCTDRIAVALDVEQGGRLNWVQDIFVAAAGAGDGSRKGIANETIIRECDVLTNGIFSKMWSDANNGVVAPVVSSDVVSVHLGTYRDSNDQPRDLRSIDYLTVLSDCPKDIDRVADVTASLMPGLCNAVTLSDRRQYLKKAVSDFNVTAMATRVFFSPGFIRTLVRAFIQAGVSFRSDDLLGYGKTGQRVVINYNLGDNIGGDGLYRSNYQQAAAPGVPGGGYSSPFMFR